MAAVATVMAAGVAVAAYHLRVEHSVFPWTTYAMWEAAKEFIIHPFDYLVSLGLLFILFLFAVPVLWKRRGGLFLISWAASGWIGFVLVRTAVPLTLIRYLEGYQFIPIAIGAAEGVWLLSGLLGKYGPYARRLGVLVLFGYFGVGLSATISLHRGYISSNAGNPQVYVPESVMEGFLYLERSAAQNAVILAPADTSTMIPAFTGRRVVAGHALMTLDPGKKQAEIAQWYASGGREATDLVSRYGVAYIWTDGRQVFMPEVMAEYGMQTVYDAGGVRIYKVTK